MAKQSRRHKIRHHADSAVSCMDNALSHLQAIDAIAENQSTIIDDHLPGLVEMLDGMKKILAQFAELL